MDDLVAWLRAQLDEDERTAREAEQRQTVSRRMIGRRVVEVPNQPLPQWRQSVWPPARVLREVEAKRRILGEIVGQVSQMEDQIDNEWGSLKYPTTGPFTSDVLVKLLALPYADRPGYQEEWRPR